MSERKPPISAFDALYRFLASSAMRAWLIAGGFGGLGGAVVWALLVYMGRKSPDYAAWVAISVLLGFLFVGSYQQWSHQREQIRDLGQEKLKLEFRLEERVDLALYQERQLVGNLHRLAAVCTSLGEFVQGLEEQILEQLQGLYGFIRVGIYVPQSLLGQDKGFRVIGKGDLGDVGTPTDVLTEGERNLAEEAFINRNQQVKIHIDRAQRKFLIGGVPIAREEDDRIWGALIVYAAGTSDADEIQFAAKLNSLRRTFVSQQLARAVEHVCETEQLRKAIDETSKGLRYQRLYTVLSVTERPDETIAIDIDYGFPIPHLEREDILTVLDNQKKLVARALHGETNLVEYHEKYSLCLLPIAEGEGTKQIKRILAVLDRGPYPFAEIESNWDTLSDLVAQLCCGIRDPETSLYSQAAFRRHLGVLLTKEIRHPLGVFLIEVEAQRDAAQKIKARIAEALQEWVTPFKENPLAMVSRYDGLCYALTLPVESAEYAIAQASGLVHRIRQSLPGDIKLDGLYIGIALMEIQCSCPVEDVLTVAFMAKDNARSHEGEIWLERIRRTTEDEVARKKVKDL